jgi:acyl-CoA dehydrogenase
MDDCDLVDTLDSVRRLIRERVVLLEAEIDEEDKVPDAIRKGSEDMGLLGFTLLGEHGGLGPSMEQESKLVMELGRTTPSSPSISGINNGIAGQVLTFRDARLFHIHEVTSQIEQVIIARWPLGDTARA